MGHLSRSCRDMIARVDRVLYYFHATDPRDNQQKSIIKMNPRPSTLSASKDGANTHTRTWYDILLSGLHVSKLLQGVLVRHTDPGGLTWEQYEQGIKVWCAEHDVNPVTPPPGNENVLEIAHFNDIYQVSNQKLNVNGKEENIDVAKFTTLWSNASRTD
ncbi:uncharacterized protein F5891DRAFT_734637 [Suillus fuscotomentosus]|uniref:Uncharacterized protein n=1 Tax=Suillus fuscotomentosus TaxID=1912939 RepID=A0AAD4DU99_9AGAM|nr:uncharacterized protein F5891DRAFT_734637 [Suillus fuscotomentosus]KAG1894051.1 hypothetical protein F5891DRAFT_734637 [Suillus fuscotomentosus]